MRVLIAHTIPYQVIQYHLALDHDQHEVVYLGKSERLGDIPSTVRAQRLERLPGESLLAAYERCYGRERLFDRFISLAESDIIPAGDLREALSFEGPHRTEAWLARDKVAMKAAAAVAGIAIPRYISGRDLVLKLNAFAVEPIAQKLRKHLGTGRIVFKPRQGASSDGVQVFQDVQAAAVHVMHLLTETDEGLKDAELEEFISGEIMHFDGYLQNGHLLMCLANLYVNSPHDFVGGAPLGDFQVSLTPEHLQWVKTVCAALQMRTGAYHIEAFATAQGELIFLEAANRVGGGGIIEATEVKTGINIPHEEIRLIMNPEPREIPDDSTLLAQANTGPWSGNITYPGHILDGKQWTLTVPPQYRQHPQLEQLIINESLQRTRKGITYQPWEIPYFAILRTDSPEASRALIREIFDKVRLNVRPEPAASGSDKRRVLLITQIPFDYYLLENGQRMLADEQDIELYVLMGLRFAKTTPPMGSVLGFAAVDWDNAAQRLELAQHLHARHQFTDIVYADEDDLDVAHSLATALGIRGPSARMASLFRNKFAMKEALSKTSVQRPEYMRTTNPQELKRFLGKHKKIVCKPVNGSGSMHTYIVDSLDSLADFLAKRAGKMADCIFEQFIAGPMYHADALVREGRILAFSVSRYYGSTLNYLSAQALKSVTVDDPQLREKAQKMLQEIVVAFEAPDVVAHLEFFETSDGSLVFCEVGARPGGGAIQHTFKALHSIQLYEECLRAQLRLPSKFRAEEEKKFRSAGFIILYSPRAGVVKAVSRPEDFTDERLIFKRISPKVGASIGSSFFSGMGPGCFAAGGNNRDEVLTVLDSVHQTFQLEIG